MGDIASILSAEFGPYVACMFLEERFRRSALSVAGCAIAASQGRLLHRPIYGYRRHPTQRGVHLVVEERADGVKVVVAMLNDGVQPREVAARMTGTFPSPRQCRLIDAGRPCEVDLPWTAVEVRAIRDHPLYRGFVVYGRARGVRADAADVSVCWVAQYQIVPCNGAFAPSSAKRKGRPSSDLHEGARE